MAYCGPNDDPVQCDALVQFAFALGVENWQASYANTWLRGSYCNWAGVTCPVVTAATYGCCNQPGSTANCNPGFMGYGVGVYGVNCTQLGVGQGAAYGGASAVYNATVTGLFTAGLTYSYEQNYYMGAPGGYVGLRGTIPASLGSLTALTSLSLSNENGLTGSLPASVGNLVNLQYLTLSNIFLNSTLDVLAPLPALVWVSLGSLRAVRGSVPNFSSPRLRYLSIGGCSQNSNVDGSCTPQLNSNGNNNYWYGFGPEPPVCSCMSEGPLPNWNLPALTNLYIQNLYGYTYYLAGGQQTTSSSRLPTGWSLPALTTLSLQNLASVFGSLPAASAYPALTSLTLSQCGLNGSLPALPSGLVTISLYGVPVTGTLDAFGSSGFTTLTSLSITSWQQGPQVALTGPIPASLVPALNRLQTTVNTVSTTCAIGNIGVGCPFPAGLTTFCATGTCFSCGVSCSA